MSHAIRSFIFAVCAATASAFTAVAEDTTEKPDPAQVLATVNGTEITLGHIIALRSDLPAQYDQFPPDVLLRGILDQLIQHELLKQSLNNDVSYRNTLRIENETRAIEAGQVMNRIVSQAPTDAELQTLYDEEYPVDMKETEYRASHILVESEELAQSVIEEIEAGAEFAVAARKHSTGPSGAAGGDLGWFGNGDMVAPFFDAVTALEKGQMSGPVKTDFGWHVIKLVETRNKERPALDTVKAELEEQFRQTSLQEFLEKLRTGADISEIDLTTLASEVINDTDLLEQ